VRRIAGGEKYSLWLMPTGEAYVRLGRILGDLSMRHGAPEFAPHVTLLGGCVGSPQEMIRRSACLAAGLRPLTVRLEGIGFLDEYFRCLFVHAVLTEPLRKAYQAACRAFGHEHEPAFMPHLSLLYGNYPRGLKEAVVAELGLRLDVQFKVKSLHLYRTSGEVGRWRGVGRFGLRF